jgi:hypothetical protein
MKSALRANHPEEFVRLHTAEIARLADRRSTSGLGAGIKAERERGTGP